MTRAISNKQALIGITVGAVVLVLLAVVMEGKMQAQWQREQLASVMISLEALTKAKEPKQITGINITARAAVVYDIKNGNTLYTKNADMQLPLASVTKLATAIVADEELGSGSLIQITDNALATEGSSGLVAGENWNERDLLDFMLVVSSNDAATALAEAVSSGDKQQFIVKMNKLAKRLGLNSTIFFNESGLDLDSRRAGAYGSARDIANLLTYTVITKPQLIEATTFTEFTSISASGLQYETVNTNKITGEIPGLIGGKTGLTDLAGGNLAVVFDAGIGRPIAVVVLGSTKEGRFTDIMRLVDSVLK